MKLPDIVFIMTDQWNARFMGCAKHPDVKTPNLDKLAEEGISFNSAYTPSPVCMPARVSLASGLYPHVHNHFMNFSSRRFPLEFITLYKTCQGTRILYRKNREISFSCTGLGKQP